MTIIKYTSIWLVAAGLLLINGCNSNINNSTVSIKINTHSKFQTIDGFGASDAWSIKFVGKNWSEETREQIADLLFSQQLDQDGNPEGIGLSIWRSNLGGGSFEQGQESQISDMWRREESFLNPNGEYDWNKCAGQQWFLTAAKKRGVEKIILFANSPLVQYTYNGRAFSNGGDTINLQPKYFEDYANYLVDVIRYFEGQGIMVDYLSPENEPQWDWKADNKGWASQEGTPASNPEVARLIRVLSDKLSVAQLETQLVVSDAGKINYMYDTVDKTNRGNQIDAFFNPVSESYIGNLPNVAHLICSHTYWSVHPMTELLSTRQKVVNEINRVDSSLKYWESEYSILEPANEDLEAGHGRDLSMKLALYVSRIIHHVLTTGNASTFQWWTALTKYDYKDGLIYLDDSTNTNRWDAEYAMHGGTYNESKTLWALGNYSRFVRPGMVRVETNQSVIDSTQRYGVFSSSYIDEASGKLVVVLVNYGPDQQNISIQVNNEKSVLFTAYVTSEEYNLTKMGQVNTNNINLLPNSVTTLVGNLK